MILFKKISFIVFINLFFCINYSFANSIEFNKEQFDRVKAEHKGKQWLMLLWSIDCPPCFKELAIIQKLQNQYNDLKVVIINTDADNEINDERKKVIEKFELDKLENFHFMEGKGYQGRFLVDPQWYGELPRSYFIEKSGKFHGKSGLVNESLLIHWLVPNDSA
jgi:thiol-disulfide isomerase/thioredoxin